MSENEVIKDHLGNELKVGDKVAVAYTIGRTAAMRVGIILRFTKSGLAAVSKKKDWSGAQGYGNVTPHRCVLLEAA